MDNKKVYSIVINGISESVSAVESLNKQLNDLDKRIKELGSKNIKIDGGSVDNSAIKEQVAKQKELNQLKKEEAAQQRLIAGEYDNTMKGMKQNLADLKTVINATDLGDSDSIKNMTKDANALTNKLKEMEQAYGQFGRNVGNYANGVAEGLQKIRINVGGTVREFDSAKQAAKTLGNELKTMAVNGEQGTKSFKDMQKAVAQLNSDIKDATVSSKGMDALLDTMQSFAAIGSVTQGVSALFGIDDTEIERSIQKLVALQNVMQGIEKINQQINSQEGIGGWLAKGNSMIDSFVAKIAGAAKAQETLNTATKAGAVASEGLAVAQEAQATATASATVATKALSVALKSIGIGLVVAAVAYLVENWEDLYDTLTDTIPALKNLGNWFDKIKAIVMGVGSAVVNYMIQPLATAAKTIQAIISGNFSDIPKIISDGFKQTFNVVGNFQKGYNKEIERQQDAHNKKLIDKQKKANDEWIKDEEAKYGKSLANTRKYVNDQIKLIDQELSKTKKGSKRYDELVQERKELQRTLYAAEREDRDKRQKQAEKYNKEYEKKTLDAEKELIRLRIENMKEGLNKTMKQLEEERRQKIAKIRADGVMVKELELETNKYYDHKIAEAKKKHAEDIVKTYKEMWDAILAMNLQNHQKNVELADNETKLMTKKLENSKNILFDQNIASYGIQGKNQYSPSTQQSLGIVSTSKDEMVKEYKELFAIMREYTTAENAYKIAQLTKASEEDLGIIKMTLDAKKKLYDEEKAALEEKYSSEEEKAKANYIMQALLDENYTKSLDTTFQQRMTAVETYWAARKDNEKTSAEELYEQYKLLEEVELQDRLKKAKENADKLQEQLDDNHDKGLLSEEMYCAMNERIWKEYSDQVELLKIESNQKLQELENEKNDKLKKENAEYYQDALQEFRDFQTAINNLEQKQPVRNILGIVNLKETNKNNRELLASFEELVRQVNMKRTQLIEDFKNGLIDNNIYESSLREMDSFVANIGERMDKVKYELSFGGQWEQLVEGINYWMQAVGQAVNSVLSSLSEVTDNHYQEEIDKQQDYIDKYEDLLNKQKEITQKHADEVNSIEDELATSRGDRRQHLIDQLNAEMAAQRASLAQEKEIEREKQKAEEKQKKLEHDQAVAKKRMQEAQAYINMAMAISMAAVNSWPIPAIPMMALAAATGAAQIAAIKSQNIPSYGSGGVIQGKSHAQGGVKVLGGQAEVEGGEFITNKQTTSKNVDLLDYINSKHRKLNINDFIDFYSKDVKKSIASSSPRSKFADGGIIPTLNNEYQFDDRLLSAFEDYSNRPVYVSVVDINSRQAAVKNVQVLAGLEE